MISQGEKRIYRSLCSNQQLKAFKVVVKETDLLILANQELEKQARDLTLKHRLALDTYVEANPGFIRSLTPVEYDPFAPSIVKTMMQAGSLAEVGPMASVAGAVADYVGKDLLSFSDEIIIENGGDIFIKTKSALTVAVFAGRSPLSNRIGLRVLPRPQGLGVCTSSGTVGHSLSFGRADAAVIIAETAAIADAVATRAGNLVKSKLDIAAAISAARDIKQVFGVLIIIGDKMGAWGEIELVSLQG